MSLQMECNVHHPLPNQPSIAGSKHSLAMQCANPQCSKEFLYLREGTLELLELESHSDDQLRPDDSAFAMRSLPSKFFWLCGECTKTHIVKRWTTSGLVVVLRNQNTADSPPDLAARPATTADVPSGPDAQQLTPPAALIVAPNISPSSVISPSLQRICR